MDTILATFLDIYIYIYIMIMEISWYFMIFHGHIESWTLDIKKKNMDIILDVMIMEI